MASPFHVFRKNQKILIATLGLLAIGAFVFLPMVLKMMTGPDAGRAGENPVVVTTTKYGNLTLRDIGIMQGQKRKLHSFFSDLVSQTCRSNQFSLRQNLGKINAYFGNTQEESVVTNWLLTQRAKELGMRVNDDGVMNFIESVTDNNINPQVMKELLRRYEISEDTLFALLQQELLWVNFAQSLQYSFLAGTPAQRWNQYQRLNRNVSAQVSPVVAADFVKKVSEPTEKQLKEFFEEHKTNITQPDSSVPGFRIAEMADIKYLKANYDQFANPASVTDEEIKKYYNENREYYKKFDLPGVEGIELSSPLQGLPGSGIDLDKSPVAETPATETTPGTTEPEEKSTPETTEPEETPAPTTEKPESSSSNVTRSRFHLVSMQEPKDQKAAEPKTETTPNQPAETAQPKEPSETPTTTDTDISPSTLGANLSELKTAPSDAPTTLTGDTYRPLSEVKDSIRSHLASQKALQRMQRELKIAKKKIDDHYRDVAISDDEKNPPVLDFAKLAKKHGLTLNQTDLVTTLELRETDIGKSIIDGTRQSVADIIIESAHNEQLRNSMDSDLNQYLFWRVKKTEEKTPKFDDEGVREKVVKAWKEVQSRDLAMKEAERLAEIARKSKKTLGNSIAKSQGVTVKPTGFFSWFKYYLPAGTYQRRSIQLGDPTNVDKPGFDFMEAVYDLQPKEITTAMNEPKTVVYVIQLIDTDTDTKAGKKRLWKNFLKEPFQSYAEVAHFDQLKAKFKWMKNLTEEAGLEWERPPIQQKPQAR